VLFDYPDGSKKPVSVELWIVSGKYISKRVGQVWDI
jgi:hypothetical protein